MISPKRQKDPRSFEIRVKDELQRALASGELGISPNAAAIFHGKGYHSRDRRATLKTDISIEVTRPGQAEPWLLWIWECKDYSSPVPVNDIEEFHAKLEQIGADRTKGTVITSANFQRAAVEFAKAKGVGLVRRAPDGSRIYLVEAVRALTDEHLLRGLTAEDTTRIESLFYGLTESGDGLTRLDDFLRKELS